MRKLVIVAIAALALGGCTGSHIRKPVVCDGKHRRPANLYGTILPTLPVPLPASQGGGQSMIAPGPGPGPGPLPAPPPVPTPGPPAATTPNAGVPAGKALGTGAVGAAPAAPQTSRRDPAPSFYSC